MIDTSFLTTGKYTGHQPVSDEVIQIWKDIKEKTDFKSMMEIGFNAGHSSTIMLSLFPDITIHSYDIGQFDTTLKNAEIVKEKFSGRFDYTIIDSTQIDYTTIADKFDIIFIDGGHDYPIVISDIELALKAKIPYIVMDDMHAKGVKKAAFERLKTKTVIYENKYLAMLPTWMRDDKTKKRLTVPIKLYKT